jgi:hypothetical protein
MKLSDNRTVGPTIQPSEFKMRELSSAETEAVGGAMLSLGQLGRMVGLTLDGWSCKLTRDDEGSINGYECTRK